MDPTSFSSYTILLYHCRSAEEDCTFFGISFAKNWKFNFYDIRASAVVSTIIRKSDQFVHELFQEVSEMRWQCYC